MKFFILIIAAFLLIVGLLMSATSIDAGELGLVTRFGKVKEVLEPGFSMVGVFDDVTKFQTRNNKYEAIANAGTIDLQTAVVSIAVNYEIDKTRIAEIYTQFGTDYINRIFAQNVQESVKSVTAKYPASELITKRDEVKALVTKKLTDTVNKYVVVTDVAITNIDFSDSFDSAIEQKVVAEQEAQKAKNILERNKTEAEAIKVQIEAIKQSGGAEYIQLKAIEKWNGVLPQYTGGAMPFINLNK